ncbi:MAG: leucine-rich repeat domain-containing protein [Oligoflexales bacterium]
MKNKFFFSLAILILSNFFGCKTKQDNQSNQDVIDQCNTTENYTWYEGRCIKESDRDKKLAEANCNLKSATHAWINGECVSKDDVITPRERCEDRGDSSYWHVDANMNGTCIGPTNVESNRETCTKKVEDGFIWDSENSRCLSQEAQRCERGGDFWTNDQRCIKPAEKSCIERQDGSNWEGGECISADEVNCKKRGSDFVWKDIGGVKQCTRKSFLEYCLDSEAGNATSSITHTVTVLRSLTDTRNLSCQETNNILLFKKSLDLREQGISNLAPIAGYTELSVLALQSNNIKDISFIEGLYKLTRLDLTTNQVNDLNPLKNLGFLKDLYLSYNEISDLTPLAGMESLNSLYLSKNKISEINGLVSLSENLNGGLKSLRTLDISDNCEITDIKELLRLSKLEVLVVDLIGTDDIPSFPEGVSIIKDKKCQ